MPQHSLRVSFRHLSSEAQQAGSQAWRPIKVEFRHGSTYLAAAVSTTDYQSRLDAIFPTAPLMSSHMKLLQHGRMQCGAALLWKAEKSAACHLSRGAGPGALGAFHCLWRQVGANSHRVAFSCMWWRVNSSVHGTLAALMMPVADVPDVHLTLSIAC